MNKKIATGIEYIWLALAILSLITGFYETNNKGMEESYVWFIMTFIAFLMFTYRRYTRKHFNKNNEK
ncbi:MAG: hypothetical protein JXR58_13955 [Bacteroidales bacterium]|nr:hypothetical protein [Bacteroidales bacterium]